MVIKRFDFIFILMFFLLAVFLTFLKYELGESIILITIMLIFNMCLVLLGLFLVNKLVEIPKGMYFVFLFYLIIASVFYWLILSTLLNFLYGTFISKSGVYYFITTRTFYGKISFYAFSIIIIFSLSTLMFRSAKKSILNQQKIQKINNKITKNINKELPKEIELKRTVNLLYIFILIIVILMIIMFLPEVYSYKTGPIIYFINQFFNSHPEVHKNISYSPEIQDKIFNISLNIKNPNIIWIMMESISAEHIHYYGYERDITPNMDLLAKEGIVFNYSYSSASHSDYSQPSVLSSKYVLINEYRNFFDINYLRTFIWDVLKLNNYATGYISSQDDEWANMINYYNKTNLDLYWYSLSDNKYNYGSGNARKDFDESTINKSIEWLNNTSGPFFLYINLQATHYPYSYPENSSVFLPDNKSSFLTNYFNIEDKDYNASVNKYDNSIYYADKQIGKLISYLKEKRLYDDSLIILTSDHGEILEKRHGYLRHGYGVYEEEVRVPMIFIIPGQEHQIINNRVRHLDVIPTVLKIANFSFSDEFEGKEMAEVSDIFLMSQNQNFNVGLIKNDIKYIYDLNSYLAEVYNLSEDPYEKNNLIKNQDDEEHYAMEYGSILFQWYYCQLEYYEKEIYLREEKNNCQDPKFRGTFSSLKPNLMKKKIFKTPDELIYQQ